jgi:hypothetical protein
MVRNIYLFTNNITGFSWQMTNGKWVKKTPINKNLGFDPE